jgi:hypothetical protein
MLLGASLSFGALLVVGVALTFRVIPVFRNTKISKLFLLSHSLIVVAFILLSEPITAVSKETTYGDLYWPYLIVPGFHIYWPLKCLIDVWLPPILRMHGVAERTVSFNTVVLMPGVGGAIVGGTLWYLIGRFFEWKWGEKEKWHSQSR